MSIQWIDGLSALNAMLDCIGNDHADDHSIAKILVDNEMDLRALVQVVNALKDLRDAVD